jgi:hypothetical protein
MYNINDVVLVDFPIKGKIFQDSFIITEIKEDSVYVGESTTGRKIWFTESQIIKLTHREK